MTHITKDINRICINWCPMADICDKNHFCESIKKIKELIIKISEIGEYGKN